MKLLFIAAVLGLVGCQIEGTYTPKDADELCEQVGVCNAELSPLLFDDRASDEQFIWDQEAKAQDATVLHYTNEQIAAMMKAERGVNPSMPSNLLVLGDGVTGEWLQYQPSPLATFAEPTTLTYPIIGYADNTHVEIFTNSAACKAGTDEGCEWITR